MRPRRASRLAGALAGAAFAVLLATPGAAHTASRGLHLHVSPEPVAPGAEVSVEVDAVEAIRRLRIAFVGEETREVQPEEPARRLTVRLAVPAAGEGGTASLHAEAHTVGGRTLRASAVVRLTPEGDGPDQDPSPDHP